MEVAGFSHRPGWRPGPQMGVFMREAADAVTDLANRDELIARIDDFLADGRAGQAEVAVVAIGLWRFEEITDLFGYAVADQLVHYVATCLRIVAGPSVVLGRLRSNEFVLVLPAVHTVTEAEEMATRAAQRLAEPLTLDGHEMVVTTHVGIVLSGGEAAGGELLRAAVAVLRRAAAGGEMGRQLVFDAREDRIAREQTALELDLRRACRRQEWMLHYQPIVDLRHRRVVGVEALARWHHPRRGLLGSDQFIPLAEATGSIVPLDQWVLGEACRMGDRWAARHPRDPLAISVNLSGRQFGQGKFVDAVQETLSHVAFPPSRLILEITESAQIPDMGRAAQVIRHLRGLGLTVALDDFGMGYASLEYLKRLPVNLLKVDRCFLDDGPDVSHGAEAFLDTAATLGARLGVTLVAEGIETTEQLALTRRLGFDWGQGFLFGRPMPADELEGWLAAWNGGSHSVSWV